MATIEQIKAAGQYFEPVSSGGQLKIIGEGIGLVARQNSHNIYSDGRPYIQCGEEVRADLISVDGKYSGCVHISGRPLWWPAIMFDLANSPTG